MIISPNLSVLGGLGARYNFFRLSGILKFQLILVRTRSFELEERNMRVG